MRWCSWSRQALALAFDMAQAHAQAYGHCPADAGQAHGNAKQDWSMASSAMSFHGMHCEALPKSQCLSGMQPCFAYRTVLHPAQRQSSSVNWCDLPQLRGKLCTARRSYPAL